MIKVSVIIPTYNNEKYLKECIDSVVGQTLGDIEIIIVNDGSTDSTEDILEEYVKKNDRIRVFNRPNRGYGYAVNLGIREAKGEYIGIVESDDFIEADMYERLYRTAKSNECDWVKADYQIFVGNGEEREFVYKNICSPDLYGKILNPKENHAVFETQLYTWAGIYKRSFLETNNIKHNESGGASFQDNGFWFQVMVAASRIMFLKGALYNLRRDNPNSSIMSKEKVFCICEEYKFIYARVFKKGEINKELLDEFWYKRYKTYNVHLNRISDDYKLEFLERFSRDFNDARRKRELKSTLFSESDWNMLQLIMVNYEVAHICKYKNIAGLNNYINGLEIKNVYIADEIGKRIFGQLFRSNPAIEFNQVVIPDYKVLDERRKLQYYHGYKVTLLHRVRNDEKHDALLMCCANSKWTDELAGLQNRKFSEIIPISQNFLINNNILISVVITVFNKKEYIRECIDSVVNQTYNNLEIIIVDDGSTDGSSEICDEYGKTDQRVIVLHKKNEGLVNARKSGVKVAQGQYVTYVDADDWIENDYFEKVYWKIIENGADIIATGFIKEKENEVSEVKNCIKTGYYEKDDLIKEIYCKMLYFGKVYKFGINQYVWSKIVKRDILLKNQLLIDGEIGNGEDVACVYPCFLDAKSIEVFNTCRYHYRIYSSSMSTQCDDYFVDNAYKLYKFLRDRFAASEHSKILQWQLAHYMVYLHQVSAKSAYGLGFKGDYPFDFGKISYGQKVVLIGGGERGTSYYKQLKTTPLCELIAWINCNIEEGDDNIEAKLRKVDEENADLFVVGTRDAAIFNKIQTSLIERGIMKNKIVKIS